MWHGHRLTLGCSAMTGAVTTSPYDTRSGAESGIQSEQPCWRKDVLNTEVAM